MTKYEYEKLKPYYEELEALQYEFDKLRRENIPCETTYSDEYMKYYNIGIQIQVCKDKIVFLVKTMLREVQ